MTRSLKASLELLEGRQLLSAHVAAGKTSQALVGAAGGGGSAPAWSPGPGQGSAPAAATDALSDLNATPNTSSGSLSASLLAQTLAPAGGGWVLGYSRTSGDGSSLQASPVEKKDPSPDSSGSSASGSAPNSHPTPQRQGSPGGNTADQTSSNTPSVDQDPGTDPLTPPWAPPRDPSSAKGAVLGVPPGPQPGPAESGPPAAIADRPRDVSGIIAASRMARSPVATDPISRRLTGLERGRSLSRPEPPDVSSLRSVLGAQERMLKAVRLSIETAIPNASEFLNAGGADLVAAFAPIDTAAVERAFDAVLERLGVLESETPAEEGGSPLLPEVAATAVAFSFIELVRRRARGSWEQRSDRAPGGDEDDVSFLGLPGPPGRWDTTEEA